MKQEYKDMMMKFLENNPELEVTSNPIGWYRTNEKIGGLEVDGRMSTIYTIRKGKIEHAMVSLFIRDKAPLCTSYKFKYNNDEKAFVGRIKKRDNLNRFVDVQVKVPEHIYFNTVDFVIDVNGKSSIKCDAQFNIRNGMVPKDMEDVRKRIEASVCRQFREQLVGKGRVTSERHRRTVTYSDVLNMEFKCNIIVHNNEDFTIKL